MSKPFRVSASVPVRGDASFAGPEPALTCVPRSLADGRWAVILAGGDGKRLLPLTRKLSGDDRPKQFCKVLGPETLLDQTLRRVARVVSPARTFPIVTKAHEGFYSGYSPEKLVVQPLNQGTAPAIVYSLMRLRELSPDPVVGFFPSDHYFSDDIAFAACVNRAFEFAELHSDKVVLLGVTPTHPETGYGWIEPDEPAMAAGRGMIFGVRAFWEKPSNATAVGLMRRGCFWNSFVMIGRAEAFFDLIRRTVPYLLRVFQVIRPALLTRHEEASVLNVYRSIPPSSFSEEVLSIFPGSLAVVCSKTLQWTDVGEVSRALSLINRRRNGLAEIQRELETPAKVHLMTAAG